MSDTSETELRDPNTLPHYVLATAFGEQKGAVVDEDLAFKNRSVWNAWALSHLNDDEKQAFYEGLPPEFDQDWINAVADVPHWRALVEEAFQERFFGEDVPSIPDPQHDVDFGQAQYTRRVDLGGFIFSGKAMFLRSEFHLIADCRCSVFTDDCYFGQAKFEFSLPLDGALFQCSCEFDGTSGREFLVREAVFQSEVPSISASTSFDNAQLTQDEARWPNFTKGTIYVAARARYVALRRFAAELHDTDMEHFFYRQEMRCIIAENADNFWKRLPYQAFRVFSDFGHSIARPVQWLAGLWGVMAVLFAVFFHLGKNPTGFALADGGEPFQLLGFSLGYSAANMFAFLGFRGLYFEKQIELMSGWVHFFSAAQTMASFALLFFLALALRNRFRLQ